MQSELEQKLLHILGNLKGGVITADEALQKIEQAYAEQWIKVEEELPENVKELIGNNIQSKSVIVKRRWSDTGEIVIEINYRFRPSEKIGFLWNYNYEGSQIIEWRPISRL
jgi:ABC-type Mn2+/Zn2+ transport system ATPase subunit